MMTFTLWAAAMLLGVFLLVLALVANLRVRRGEQPLNPLGITEQQDSNGDGSVLPAPIPQEKTDRRNAQAEWLALIAGDGTRLKQFLEAMPIGVVAFDSELRVIYWNRQCETIFGWRSEEVLGRTPWESYAPEITAEQVNSMLARIHTKRDDYVLAHDGHRKSGGIRHCTWSVSPERDEQDQLVRVLALVQDVTEQRRAEAVQARYASEISALARQLLDHDAQINRRIAQMLHDSLGQTLGALRMAFDVIDAQACSPQVWKESAMGSLIDQAVEEVRDALIELRPPLLNEQGLQAALDNEIRSHWRNPNRVRTALTTEDDADKRRYPSDVEYAAFMIAREAIGNALRHAKPHHVGVHMSETDGQLTLEIKDDGMGFEEPHSLPRPGHLGLVGMRERALAVNAVLTVKSLVGVGTCVRFMWCDSGSKNLDQVADGATFLATVAVPQVQLLERET